MPFLFPLYHPAPVCQENRPGFAVPVTNRRNRYGAAFYTGGVALGSSGLSAIVVAILNHHWAKKKNSSGKLDALVEAQKVLMIDRVRYLGSSYIHDGEIALEDKENLAEMYQSIQKDWTGGKNGHLSTVMAEVERLPVAEKR